jgi:two-component system response regulator YesN
MSIFGLVFSLDHAMMESGSSVRFWQDEKMKQYIKDQLLYGTLYDTKLMLEDYISRRCDEFSVIISNQGDKLVYDIKTLIEHNLANEDFNLESASSQLFFSANYVRQVFKQKTGEGFTEYLIQKRMERAGELLQNPTNKIQDVAQSTGYSSQRYFSSVFKKYYSCTPTEYREKLLNDK